MRSVEGTPRRSWPFFMNSFSEVPPALSIRQPWVDLILKGEKTIEVREWPVSHRGPLLVHAARTIDWKTTALLRYDRAQELPRGGLIAVIEIVDAFEFTRESWLELQSRHRVLHPPVRQPIYGAQINSVVAFRELISCRGRSSLFTVPSEIAARTKRELASLGLLTDTGG